MKLPRDVSGERLAGVLCRQWQYRRVHQSGSHIIIETDEPSQQRIAVPNHVTLRIGTFHSILKAVASHKGVSREAVLEAL
jgi:predicted RNA binding protein YcfA (HicA-like mRNA interferase family)